MLHVTISQHQNITTSQRHNVTTSQRHNVTTSQRHNVTTSQRHNVTTSQRHNVTTSQHHSDIRIAVFHIFLPRSKRDECTYFSQQKLGCIVCVYIFTEAKRAPDMSAINSAVLSFYHHKDNGTFYSVVKFCLQFSSVEYGQQTCAQGR